MKCLLHSLETTCMCGLMYILHLEIFHLIIEFHCLNVDYLNEYSEQYKCLPAL